MLAKNLPVWGGKTLMPVVEGRLGLDWTQQESRKRVIYKWAENWAQGTHTYIRGRKDIKKEVGIQKKKEKKKAAGEWKGLLEWK